VIDQPDYAGLFIEGPDGESIRVDAGEDDLCIQTGVVTQILTGKVFQGTVHFAPNLLSPDICRANHIEFFGCSSDTLVNPPFEPDTPLCFNENEFKGTPITSFIFWEKDMKLRDLNILMNKYLMLSINSKRYEEIQVND
jgi:hypothetical protein